MFDLQVVAPYLIGVWAAFLFYLLAYETLARRRVYERIMNKYYERHDHWEPNSKPMTEDEHKAVHDYAMRYAYSRESLDEVVPFPSLLSKEK